MEAKLFFGVRHKFDLTVNKLLKERAALTIWDQKEYLYIFHISKKEEIEALTGKTVEIEGHIYNKERITLPKWKGKDIVEIKAFPKIYRLITHKKQEDGSIKELPHDVDRATVDAIYKDIVAHMPLNKPIKTATFAEKICRYFNLQRFFNETGNFDFARFFGKRTEGYFRYFYYPAKVLVHLKKIKHHKAGKIERLK